MRAASTSYEYMSRAKYICVTLRHDLGRRIISTMLEDIRHDAGALVEPLR